MLALVLQDHVVDEAIFQQRILNTEVGRLERLFSDGVEVDVGAFAVEQGVVELKGRPLDWCVKSDTYHGAERVE